MKEKRMMGEGRLVDVEAVTEGVLINNSRSDTPSWVHAPLSILTVEACAQHQAVDLRWSKSAMSRLMWASLLCRYSQRCFSSW